MTVGNDSFKPRGGGSGGRSPVGRGSILPSHLEVTLRRIALVVATALALTVAAVSIVRTVRSFRVLDFRASWIEQGLRVEAAPPGSSAQQAGLKAGDLIEAIDGAEVSALDHPLRRLTRGGLHRLEVERRPAGRLTVEFRAPPLQTDPVYLARSVVAVVGILCALFAVLGTARDEATTFLLLALTALVLATVPHRTAASSLLFALLHRGSGAALPFLLVRFFAIFPERGKMPVLWDVLTGAAFAGSAATVILPAGRALWPAVAVGLRTAFVAALLAGAVIQTRRWKTAVRVARVRRQIEWAALGMFVGLFPYGAIVLLPRWLGIGFEPFAWLGVLPVMAVSVGFLAALLEYRLWDLESITRDTVSGTLVVVIGALIFATLNRLLFTSVGSAGPLRSLLAFATGVVLVVLLQPMRRRVGSFLDQWLYHGRPTPRRLITNATRELARTTDPRQLLERLSRALREDLEMEFVATYQRTHGGDFRRITPEDPGLPELLPASVVDADFPAESEAALGKSGLALRIALDRGSAVHGLLYLGLRRGIFPLGREGREVVVALAAQAALGLESAALLDDLRRQAEEYRILHANTRRIIESSAAGILVCDATGRILSSNARAAGIFSRSEAEMVGRPLSELVRLPESWIPQLPMHALNAEGRTIAGPPSDGPSPEESGKLGRSAAEPRWLVMAVSVLELESGRFNGRVVVLQDVTELRNLQDRLREQERLASLGRLASGLAHEINTPLTGIASFAQLLGEMTPEEDPRSELVGKLVDQSFRVSRIVANLHEAMRTTGGEPSRVDLGGIVRRSAEDAARSVDRVGGVRVSIPEAPVWIEVSTGAVQLAVSNLVRNALEASPAGSVVEVAVTEDGPWATIVVLDQGPGIPKELEEKVFEPFFTTRSEGGGTGLGLAITRDMIARQGGEVRLERAPERGTRAVILLPRSGATATS